MSDLTATGGVPGPGRIGRVAVGDILRRAAKRFGVQLVAELTNEKIITKGNLVF